MLLRTSTKVKIKASVQKFDTHIPLQVNNMARYDQCVSYSVNSRSLTMHPTPLKLNQRVIVVSSATLLSPHTNLRKTSFNLPSEKQAVVAQRAGCRGEKFSSTSPSLFLLLANCSVAGSVDEPRWLLGRAGGAGARGFSRTGHVVEATVCSCRC